MADRQPTDEPTTPKAASPKPNATRTDSSAAAASPASAAAKPPAKPAAKPAIKPATKPTSAAAKSNKAKPRSTATANAPVGGPTLTRRTTRVDSEPSGSVVPASTGPGLSSVDARSVTVTQGGIGAAKADQVDVRQGGIGRVEATDVAVSQGGIGIARGDRVSVEMGGIGVAIASEARVSQGYVRNVLARDFRFEQGLIGTVVTGRATFERTGAVFLLVARNVDGNVKALLDWRGAVAFGAVAGILIGLLRRRER